MKKNKMDTQEYQFIKETVKKQPKENGSLLRRLLMIAGCGVLFGGCAAVTFASVFPVMADREENTQQKIELTGSDVAETISEEQATERESVASVSEQEEKSLLAMRQEMYREVLKVSQKSRKSLDSDSKLFRPRISMGRFLQLPESRLQTRRCKSMQQQQWKHTQLK